MKKILITGANSYIGTSFENYIKERFPNQYTVDTVDMIDGSWREKSFSGYDAVFHVAGIAHVKETDENRSLYYSVNRDLAIETANKAKADGVNHFVILSTMSVYGMLTGHITKQTECRPVNAYGKSKLMADEKLKKMESDSFRVAILRPPMVYGKNCKGNYQQLRRFALKSPIFPKYYNERSMVYIDNLCEFVRKIIDNGKYGVFFPQNRDYICTNDMVKLIAQSHGKKISLWSAFNPVIKIFQIGVVKKVFGTLTYEKTDLVNLVGFEDSIKATEK